MCDLIKELPVIFVGLIAPLARCGLLLQMSCHIVCVCVCVCVCICVFVCVCLCVCVCVYLETVKHVLDVATDPPVERGNFDGNLAHQQAS